MTSRLQYTMWFGLSFLAALVALSGLRLWFAGDNSPAPPVTDAALVLDNSMLVGHSLPTAALLEVQSKAHKRVPQERIPLRGRDDHAGAGSQQDRQAPPWVLLGVPVTGAPIRVDGVS